MVRIFLLLAFVVSLTGCSSFLATAQSDPFRIGYVGPEGADIWGTSENNLLGVISLDATRRVVMVNLVDGKFCAEGPPDVGVNLNISSEGKATASAGANVGAAAPAAAVELDEKYESTITKLADRTALLDIYRAGNQSLCQYHLNGAFAGNNEGLIEAFNDLTDKVLTAYITSK